MKYLMRIAALLVLFACAIPILAQEDKNAEINKIIENRQNKNVNIVQQVVNQTSAKELMEYKELLDSGVISQEEFDAKKKQLLDL